MACFHLLLLLGGALASHAQPVKEKTSYHLPNNNALAAGKSACPAQAGHARAAALILFSCPTAVMTVFSI